MDVEIVEDNEDGLNVRMLEGDSALKGYVISLTQEWLDYVDANHFSQWDEFYRIWRGIWAAEDKTRTLERSRIVTPASQQAVESAVCEIEEATFGQGFYFDIRDDNIELTKLRQKQKQLEKQKPPTQPPPGQAPMAPMGPQGPQGMPPQGPQMPPMGDAAPMAPMGQPPMPQGAPEAPQEPTPEELIGNDMAYLRRQLEEDMKKQRVRASTAEVLINAAVWGTGIAEVVIAEEDEIKPASEPIEGAGMEQMSAYGVNVTPRTVIKMKPVLIKNFRIDPVATSVENAHGVAIQEYVPMHSVKALQASGVYKKGHVGTPAVDMDLEPDPELDVINTDGKVELLKYFGLVPKSMLEAAVKSLEDEDLEEGDTMEDLSIGTDSEDDGDDDDGHDELVEAIIIIANGEFLLKAEPNPYMMKDRPVVAFQWDIVPGLFYGRGVVEKAYNSQKALDAEIRARIDALALTIHPMLAMDSTKIPRGHKPQIVPGKMILTNGNPSETLMPFKFGDVSQISFSQAGELQKMVQQATGSVDSNGIGGQISGEATAAGISMSLGAVIKRQKRTLVNFQENFWIPFVEKSAWRYMQFAPEVYPIKDYNFVATSTLGIMAREYQVSQLVQLLQTMSPESPMYPKLVESIVESMNITNRDELVEILQNASAPDPKKIEQQEQMQQLELENQAAIVDYAKAQAEESRARAAKYLGEAEALPEEIEIKKIDAITKNLQPGLEDDQEFTKRLQIADVALRERGLDIQQEGMRQPTGPAAAPMAPEAPPMAMPPQGLPPGVA